MSFVQFNKVSLAFGDRDILKDVSVNLSSGTKAALTGANGSGKSTLIKVMAGLVKSDEGQRVVQKNTRIAYLPQSGLIHKGCTLREEGDKAFSFGYELMNELEEVGEKLKQGSGNEKSLLERHEQILTELEESGWNRRNVLLEQVFIGLGFSREDLDRDCSQFSGGWQMRIALGKALMVNPDILLLDEPTNYLDIEARQWLEKFLDNFKGGFLLVSHDRYFLDHTVNEVYELFNGELHRYPGNFSHYEKVRQQELETLIKEYEKQQEEIARLQEFINRFGYKATKAAQAQERQKMLDKILENEIVIPESLKKIHFKFPPAPHSGRIAAVLTGISKSYDGTKNVIDNFEIVLENSDRLVVVGHNGAGKSTLLRIIAGVDKDFQGEVKIGAGVKIGYFSQDNAEIISGSATVLETIEEDAPFELIPKVRDMLGAFLFRGDDVYKTLDMLSGGEKSRIALLKLLLRPVNLLILDEPTNHLDIHSKDVLLQALKDFGGTVVFVSHDRGFIEGLATRVLELKPGESRIFPGDYEYYVQRLEAESLEEGKSVSGKTKKTAAGKTEEKSALKLSWEEQKKIESERRKAEKNVKLLEEKIFSLEEQKKEAENLLANPKVYSSGEKSREVRKKIEEIDDVLEDLNIQWMEAAEKLESFAK